MTIPFVPVSGWNGENLTETATSMPWYDGPHLLQALDKMSPPKRPVESPLRVPIQDVYKIGGIGTVPIGRVESGVIKVGQMAHFAPSGIDSKIQSLEMHHEECEECFPGDNVGFHVKGVSLADIRRGHVASNADDHPAASISSFDAQVIVMNHPGTIRKNYTPIVDCHTAHVACRFSEIKEKMDRRTGQVLEENPETIQTGDACLVTLEPKQPMTCETFAEYPPLGRFAIRDMRQTIGVGVIKAVTKVTPEC